MQKKEVSTSQWSMLDSICKVYDEPVPLSRWYALVCPVHNRKLKFHLERGTSPCIFPGWHSICLDEFSVPVDHLAATFQRQCKLLLLPDISDSSIFCDIFYTSLHSCRLEKKEVRWHRQHLNRKNWVKLEAYRAYIIKFNANFQK